MPDPVAAVVKATGKASMVIRTAERACTRRILRRTGA